MAYARLFCARVSNTQPGALDPNPLRKERARSRTRVRGSDLRFAHSTSVSGSRRYSRGRSAPFEAHVYGRFLRVGDGAQCRKAQVQPGQELTHILMSLAIFQPLRRNESVVARIYYSAGAEYVCIARAKVF